MMFIGSRRCLFLCLPLLFTASVSAQQPGQPTEPPVPGKIYLDVVVTEKSGPPVSGLQQQDFTLLDNKITRPITTFQALRGREAPVEVLIVLDAVNTGYDHVAFARQEIERFLHVDGGHLAYPTALAIFTETGIQIQDQFSHDGNALSSALDQYTVALRDIPRSAGFYGASDRLQLSLTALHQIAAREASLPGRKIILWVSPGWLTLSGPDVVLDYKQQKQIFANIVSFSNLLQQGHITLYSIDPLGTADFGGRSIYWQAFTKGITKPSQTDIGDLALEVIATQSGGLALNTGNDVAALLQKCLADISAYYELSFDPPISDQPHEYHPLEVKVDKHGLTARTRQSYYSQP